MKNYANSQLIYTAWLNTSKPLIYELKLDKKEVDFADPEQNKYFDGSFKGTCNICGSKITDGGVPIKKFFSSNYMDWALHKAPESTHICKACTFCLGMNTKGRIALFRYPFVAEVGQLHLCSKVQFRGFLLSPPEPPFLMVLPVSQKKHLFHKSMISYSREKFYCNYEENTIECDSSIKNVIETVEKMRFFGISLDCIKKGVLPNNVIKQCGLEKQIELVTEMNSIRHLPVYDLAAKVSFSKQQMEGIGIKYDI